MTENERSANRNETDVEATTQVEESANVEPTVSDDAATVDESTTSDEQHGESTESARLEEHLGLSGRGGAKSRRGGLRARIGVIAVVTALVVSAVLTVSLYFFQYRPDQEMEAASGVALDAATSGTIALLSYSPDSLEQDFSEAKTHLTGEFLDYYTQFTETIVTPAAKQKQVQTNASVVQSALAEMHPDSAVALVFVNQTTLSKENPDGAFAASSVKVGLTKVNDKWLISSFDPV